MTARSFPLAVDGLAHELAGVFDGGVAKLTDHLLAAIEDVQARRRRALGEVDRPLGALPLGVGVEELSDAAVADAPIGLAGREVEAVVAELNLDRQLPTRPVREPVPVLDRRIGEAGVANRLTPLVLR